MKYAKKRNPFKYRSNLDWMRLEMERFRPKHDDYLDPYRHLKLFPAYIVKQFKVLKWAR